MNRYDSYKDSGNEWIGEIPSGWECLRLGMLGTFSSSGIDKKLKDNEVPVRMVNYTDLIQRRKYYPIQTGEKEYMKVTTPQSKLEEHRLEKGDMVFIPSSETFEDLGYSSLIDFDEEDIVYSYHILRYKTIKPIHHYYKKYLINHHSVLNQFSSECKGTTRQIIGRNVFNNVRVVLPTIKEQQEIVTFLDDKTQKIDSLIQQKKKKIELLKEKRTSLINLVVTKGLDPNVEMKYSGVEWIGEIPIHWLVSKIMFISEKVTDGSHHSPETQDSGKLYVTVSNITKENDIDFDSCSKISEESFSELERNGCKPNPGDVLITKDGTIGRGLVVGGFNDYVILSSIGLIRFSKKINPEYGLYYLLSGLNIDQMYSHVRGSGITRLTINLIKNLLLIIPSFSEQQQIVEYLDKQTEEIDTLIQLEQKKIDTLKEYRQSLISEVVTGKIRVCEEDNSLSLNSQTI